MFSKNDNLTAATLLSHQRCNCPRAALPLRLVKHRPDHRATSQQPRPAEQSQNKPLRVLTEPGTGGEKPFKP